MIKDILNCVFLAVLFSIVFMFSIENDATLMLNLFPFKTGIEAPVYIYTIVTVFLGIMIGIMLSKIHGPGKK
jgi:uncharacterized integral membrane protein